MIDRERFQALAEHLSGRLVLLRFRDPPSLGATGEAYRPADAPSLAMIDISPDLAGAELLRVFLHEVGHVRAGHVDKVKVTPAEDERSGAIDFVTSTRWRDKPRTDPREVEADALQERWQAWALDHVYRTIPKSAPWSMVLPCCLAALEFYKE